MAKVSIITPVHNDEAWLGRAIESVRAQTHGDWELIIVDDGSTDSSLAIAQGKAAADGRIVVVAQERRRSGAARNAGLDRATGEWVLFLDSDDTLEPQALEVLLAAADRYGVDHVIGGDHVVMTTDETRTAVDSEMFGAPEEDYLFFMRDFDVAAEFLVNTCGPLLYCIWGRLYKLQIIRDFDLRFTVDVPVMEDVNWTFSYLYYCDGCVCVNECLYNYFREADKDDAGCHSYIPQFLCFDKPLQSFQRMVYKFGWPEGFVHEMYDRLATQFLNYTSKLFNENAQLTEDERRVYVRHLTDTYTWRWHCHALADSSPFWAGERALLDSGYDEAAYQMLKQKMDEEGLPFTGGANIR